MQTIVSRNLQTIHTYFKKNKKMIKKIFFIPAAIVGIGVLSITVGGMACMGGAVFVCCIVKSSCECVLDVGAALAQCIGPDIQTPSTMLRLSAEFTRFPTTDFLR